MVIITTCSIPVLGFLIVFNESSVKTRNLLENIIDVIHSTIILSNHLLTCSPMPKLCETWHFKPGVCSIDQWISISDPIPTAKSIESPQDILSVGSVSITIVADDGFVSRAVGGSISASCRLT